MFKTLNRPAVRNARRPFTVSVASETLEDRIVLSSHSVLSSVVEIESVTVDNVNLEEGTATLTIVGSVLGVPLPEEGRTVTVPLELLGINTDGPAPNGCDVLNLALGPVELNLLGLNIKLDDCNDGPVTVDIYGEPGDGNLLGNLVCGVAGLLDADSTLGDLVGLLQDPDVLNGILDDLGLGTLPAGTDLVGQLEDAIAAALNQQLGLLDSDGEMDGGNGNGNGNGGNQGQGRGQSTTILDLSIEEGIYLDVLGLVVETSPICLVVSADQGSGNLLGNLLGSIAHLADRNPGNALNALLNRAERLLSNLDLGDVSDELLIANGNGKNR